MNIVDIGIIIFLAFGAILGFKRGFTKSIVKAVGLIVVIGGAFFLKNPLSIILYENLPFFKFGGVLKGIEVINILLYEAIAFVVAVVILSIIMKVIVYFTSIFEKILNATIVLGIPSKLAGTVVGIVEFYVIAFVLLYIISMPFSNIAVIKESKLKNFIIDKTPVLSMVIDKSISVVDEFVDLKDSYQDKTISEQQFDYSAIELFLKYKVVTSESISKLIDKGKIETFDNYIELLEKYREA